MNNLPLDLSMRPRRLRQSAAVRQMLQRVTLKRSDFVLPVFVIPGENKRLPVSSMPGVDQMSVDVAMQWLTLRAAEGFRAFVIFGVVDRGQKDDVGSEALNPENIVCQLLSQARQAKLPMVAITDLCFCEYTSHGHCGPLSADHHTVQNDITVTRLVTQAINHARAGAQMVAPSGMMDGTVGALRKGLDEAGFSDVSVMAYSVKYSSAFYGPFRDAADSAPAFGDRKSYQMDPARGVSEALMEAELDVQQGADLIMVKPAGAYLDVIAACRAKFDVPIVAYQVSGEYAMIEAAAKNNWIDRDRVVMESLLAIKRAGADLIITYYGPLIHTLLEG